MIRGLKLLEPGFSETAFAAFFANSLFDPSIKLSNRYWLLILFFDINVCFFLGAGFEERVAGEAWEPFEETTNS